MTEIMAEYARTLGRIRRMIRSLDCPKNPYGPLPTIGVAVPDWGVVDIEWDSNDPDERLLCLGWRDKAYLPADLYASPDEPLKQLADPLITKVAFTKADHRWLLQHGFEVAGPFHDIQAMAWIVDERTDLDLETVSRLYGTGQKDKRLLRAKGKLWFQCNDGSVTLIGDAPLDQLLAYNEQDLQTEHNLYLSLKARLKHDGLFEYWERVVQPYSSVLVRMEGNGLPINVFRTKVEAKLLRAETDKADSALKNTFELPAEFNFSSYPQLADFLYKKEFLWETRIKLSREEMMRVKDGEWVEALPPSLEPTKIGREYIYGTLRLRGLGLRARVKAPRCAEEKCGHLDGNCEPSVSTKTLKIYHYDEPWVRDYCDYKKKIKALQFLNAWLGAHRGGRLFGRFNQTGTATGRLSSSEPNLQNVPARGELGKRIRRLFEAPQGRMFVHGDFNQIEPRLMAHFSGDPEMLRVYKEGKDIYEEATVAVLGSRYPKGTPERKLVQTCFLAMGYGAREKKIQETLAEEGFYIARAKVDAAYVELASYYHVYWDWRAEHTADCEDRGYAETIGGHHRRIDWVDRKMRWKAENQAVNSTIQGSAADIASAMMVLVDQHLPFLDPVAAVHDEGLWELDEDRQDLEILNKVRWCAEEGHGYRLKVPIVFEPVFIKNWGEKA